MSVAIPNALILRIYDAALDPAAWPAVLQEVAEFCGAEGSFVFEMQGEGAGRSIRAQHLSSVHVPKLLGQYLHVHAEAELHDQNFFSSQSQATDQIDLIPDDALIDVYRAKGGLFEQPHMLAQAQYGYRHRAGALLNKDDYYRDRIAFVYSAKHGQILPENLAHAELVLPHLAKAIDVSRPAVEATKRFNSLAMAMDNIALGVCVVDRHGRTIYANPEFTRQADAFPVFSIAQDGVLSFNPDRVDRGIIDMMKMLDHHGRFGGRPRKEAVTTAVDNAGTFSLCIEVTPLHNADVFGEKNIDGHIVYSLDTGRSFGIKAGLIRELFQLTKSEVDVLGLMAEGLTNLQISDRRSKSVHTINSQVKSVLSKMNASNRTQLIRLTTNLSSSTSMPS